MSSTEFNKPDRRADMVPGTIRHQCQTRETKMFARAELYSRKNKGFSSGSKFHRLDMQFNDFLSQLILIPSEPLSGAILLIS